MAKLRIRALTVYVEGTGVQGQLGRGWKHFEGKIFRQCLHGTSRRYSYQVVWSGATPEERSLAILQDVILNEKFVERLVVERGDDQHRVRVTLALCGLVQLSVAIEEYFRTRCGR